MFVLENTFLSALGPKLDFLRWGGMQTCRPTVGRGDNKGLAKRFGSLLKTCIWLNSTKKIVLFILAKCPGVGGRDQKYVSTSFGPKTILEFFKSWKKEQ